MTKGVTLELTDWNGETGKCEKGHDVSILKGGYGYCAECGYEIEGYSTLYLPPKGFVMPGDEYGE